MCQTVICLDTVKTVGRYNSVNLGLLPAGHELISDNLSSIFEFFQSHTT